MPEEPEIERVLACELEEGDEDLIVYVLDAAAAEHAAWLEPSLRAALSPATRTTWVDEWHQFARSLITAGEVSR